MSNPEAAPRAANSELQNAMQAAIAKTNKKPKRAWATREQCLAVLQAHPGRWFSSAEIANACGHPSSDGHSAISGRLSAVFKSGNTPLLKRRKSGDKGVSHFEYRYAPYAEKPEAAYAEKPEAAPAEAPFLVTDTSSYSALIDVVWQVSTLPRNAVWALHQYLTRFLKTMK